VRRPLLPLLALTLSLTAACAPKGDPDRTQDAHAHDAPHDTAPTQAADPTRRGRRLYTRKQDLSTDNATLSRA